MLGNLRFLGHEICSLIWHFKITVGIGKVQEGNLTLNTSPQRPMATSFDQSRAARRLTSLAFVTLTLCDEEFCVGQI